MGFSMFVPKQGLEILGAIQAAGHECFLVGGCVRDAALGRRCGDYDMAASSEPEETIAALKPLKCGIIPTGIKHGTITAAYRGRAFEVTTYRVDGDYSDGRRPDAVTFTKSLAEDIKRRDFTVNAMAYDPNGPDPESRLVDLYGGMKDIEDKIIRCVGDAGERFSEDYLRMARAYRFAAVLGFKLDGATRAAASALRGNINKAAPERICAEFSKLLLSDNFEAIEMFIDDFCDVLLPEIFAEKNVTQENNYHCHDVYVHSKEVLRHAVTEAASLGIKAGGKEERLWLRLTAIFHDCGKPSRKVIDSGGVAHFKGHEEAGAVLAENALKRMKYDNATIEAVTAIIRLHDDAYIPEAPCVKRLLNRVGERIAGLVVDFIICDTMGKSASAIQYKLPKIQAVKAELERVTAAGEPYLIKHLAVNGGDIMKHAGIAPGKEVGDILNGLLLKVIEDPALNEREKLLGMLGGL